MRLYLRYRSTCRCHHATPNLTPHPTPPASPLSASVFTSASLASTSTFCSNNHNGFGGTKGNWLTLPSNHYSNQIQDPQTHDRSRSNSVGSHRHRYYFHFVFIILAATIVTTTTTTSSKYGRRPTSCFFSVVCPGSGDEEFMCIKDAPVGSPVDDVDAQPMWKAGESGPSMTLRLNSLSTVHSMSARKGGDEDEDSAVDLEVLDGLINATTTTAVAATKKRAGIRKKVETKTISLKRNSLRSPTSMLSPPLPAALHHHPLHRRQIKNKEPLCLP